MKNLIANNGDVFALGEHRILCGDSCDAKLIKSFLQDTTVSLILTDPPYGVAYVEGKDKFHRTKQKHEAIANDHLQSNEEYNTFTRQWLEAVKPFLARKNSLYCFNSDKMVFPLREGMVDAGFHFGQLLIWVKTNAVIGRLDYLPQHELICYGWHGVHEFRKSKDKSVLVCPKPTQSKLHPTMKPIPLLRRLILNSSCIGDVIYDPFLGSGSALLAAEDTARRCFAVEISPEYCCVAIERYTKRTGIAPTRISSLPTI